MRKNKQAVLLFTLFVLGCKIIAIEARTMNHKNGTTKEGNAISQELFPVFMKNVHQFVKKSINLISQQFGRCTISKKKTKDDKSKKEVKNGPNIMFPTTLIAEIGKPQWTKIGRETIEMNKCAWIM